jgi:hypothetical protein
MVYACTERLEKHCIDAEPMLDKNPESRKNGRSAHLVLWICRTFSTVELVLQVLSILRSQFLDARQVLQRFWMGRVHLFFLQT